MPGFNQHARGNRDSGIFDGPVQAARHDPNRHDPTRSSIPGGVFGGGADDFLSRLEKAEQRDSHRQPAKNPMAGPVDASNWQARSKNVAQLAMRNEAADRAARERAAVANGGDGYSPEQLAAKLAQESLTLP